MTCWRVIETPARWIETLRRRARECQADPPRWADLYLRQILCGVLRRDLATLRAYLESPKSQEEHHA
jgi:hypothetical protein